MNARRSIEGINAEAGVIGQSPFAGGFRDSDGFEPGIGGEGGSGLLDLQSRGLGLDGHGEVVQQPLKFTDLAGVPAGDHQGFHAASA